MIETLIKQIMMIMKYSYECIGNSIVQNIKMIAPDILKVVES